MFCVFLPRLRCSGNSEQDVDDFLGDPMDAVKHLLSEKPLRNELENDHGPYGISMGKLTISMAMASIAISEITRG